MRQNEHEREGDSKATWKEIETTSFIWVLQFSVIKIIFTWKFDLLFWPIVRFYLRHFVLIENGLYCILNANSSFCDFVFKELMFRSQQLSISYSVTAVYFSELTQWERLKSCFQLALHISMHECKNQDPERTLYSFQENSDQS